MRALSREEQALFDEMKERCLAKGQYKDEKAKDKFKMLCHLEDFMIQYWELLKENKELKEVIDKTIEYINHFSKESEVKIYGLPKCKVFIGDIEQLLEILNEVSE